MTLSEAKASVLYEAGREKRITLRNLIIVVVLVLIGIFLGVKYLLPCPIPTGYQCTYLCKVRTALGLAPGHRLPSCAGMESLQAQGTSGRSFLLNWPRRRMPYHKWDRPLPHRNSFWQALSYQYGSYLLPWGNDQEQELPATRSLPCRFGWDQARTYRSRWGSLQEVMSRAL